MGIKTHTHTDVLYLHGYTDVLFLYLYKVSDRLFDGVDGSTKMGTLIVRFAVYKIPYLVYGARRDRDEDSLFAMPEYSQ